MPLIERRYAEALVGISVQAGAVDDYQAEFENIVSVYNNQPDFRLFLLNPEVGTDAKKSVINKIFSGRIRTEMVNFLLLLLDKGRIRFLPGILGEFVKMADKKRNTLNMTIISVAPLEKAQIDEIKEKYRKAYNSARVKVSFEIDRDLIGGVKVKIGDKVTDGSIKGRLEALREILVKR